MTNDQLHYVFVFLGGLISVLVSLIYLALTRFTNNYDNFKQQTEKSFNEIRSDVSEIKTDVAVLKNNIR